MFNNAFWKSNDTCQQDVTYSLKPRPDFIGLAVVYGFLCFLNWREYFNFTISLNLVIIYFHVSVVFA